MKRIHNICEEECKPHYGKPVVLLLRDGTEVYGTLSRIHGGQLILNETAENGAAGNVTLNQKKSKKGTAPKAAGKTEASTQAFGPYPGPSPYGPVYPFAPILLDLALIALLFVLI
ncbi:hypothetical protein ACVNS2_05150 [Paenibacillus caseinilyticus]|uniref:Uncharacterized protein n=1 Tax=Paenibacillus mucilaginosus K02 TaxID=997761 RepID=I0BCG1_9BACL|nr:hypothetical protein [Paenibacillus mucilaginosus]AFH60058.1 hypothetical protein B2K_04865 [Paenibacillus mucilaginosus K02]